jgi:hypothetical protein
MNPTNAQVGAPTDAQPMGNVMVRLPPTNGVAPGVPSNGLPGSASAGNHGSQTQNGKNGVGNSYNSSLPMKEEVF